MRMETSWGHGVGALCVRTAPEANRQKPMARCCAHAGVASGCTPSVTTTNGGLPKLACRYVVQQRRSMLSVMCPP